MTSSPTRIAIPEPASADAQYSRRSWEAYAHAVERAGGEPVAMPLSASQSALARLAGGCSGVLLPGSPADVDPNKYGQQPIAKCGPKDGAREAADDLLLQDAFDLHKPILGICYGMQVLNVWRNGSLIQDLPAYRAEQLAKAGTGDPPSVPVDHKPGKEVQHAHPVTLAPTSGLSRILAGASDLERDAEDGARLWVNSSHHQAIERPGDQMRVVARSPGDGVIEALEGEAPEHFILGVQWHPERTYDASSASRLLFDAFIRAAIAWRP